MKRYAAAHAFSPGMMETACQGFAVRARCGGSDLVRNNLLNHPPEVLFAIARLRSAPRCRAWCSSHDPVVKSRKARLFLARLVRDFELLTNAFVKIRCETFQGLSARKNAAGSSPRSITSTSAEPTIAPSTYGASNETCSQVRIPKPAHTGCGETAFTRAK